MSEKVKPTIVIGHKNPDTDSIVSAIAYANLKNKKGKGSFIAARAGEINEETKFVLDYFKAQAPTYIDNIKTQVSDIEIRHTEGVNRFISLKRAWELMQNLSVVTLPAVDQNGMLEGLITVSDIAYSYMNVYDSDILAKAHTKYKNIIETLNAQIVVGDEADVFDSGRVVVSAANPDMMENIIRKNDLVILGNRYESQLSAIEMEAACIVVCEGAKVTKTIEKLATDRGTTVITTPYDTYTVARLINQSMPIYYFMKTDRLITFDEDDYIDDIRDIMASVRHRDFPVLSKDGKYLGMISRRNLLGARGKKVILVDHNEKEQAVEGIAHADVSEIIDHHRLGTMQTIAPVFFRSQPLGCTSTIIYQMYNEAGVQIDKQVAGLLCSAIISDTLLFRSPTCTKVDEAAAKELAAIAEIDLEEYAMQMFDAGSNLRGKEDKEIFYQDYKQFTAGKLLIGIGQVSSLNSKELKELKPRMRDYMLSILDGSGMDMLFLMLTDILKESTTLICVGSGAENLVANAFHIEEELERGSVDNYVELPGVVSRKKQLVPQLVMGVQE